MQAVPLSRALIAAGASACLAVGVVGVIVAAPVSAAALNLALVVRDDTGRQLAGSSVSVSLQSGSSSVEGTVSKLAKPAVRSRTIAKGISAVDGRVAVSVPYTQALAKIAAENGGWVNFEAAVGDAKHAGFVSFYRKWNGVAWVDRDGKSSTAAVTAARVVQRTGAVSRAAAPHATCVWWGPTAGTSSPAIVGELHTGHDVRGSFQYGQRADSDLDVSYKYGSGSWSAGGGGHVGNSRGAEVAWVDRGPEWRYALTSQFNFLKYEYIRDASCGPSGRIDYKIVPDVWNGGTGTEAQKTGSWCTTTTYRTQYAPSSRLTRNSYRAHQYNVGITAFGVSAGGVSGYSGNVDFSLTTGTAMNYYWLCGNTDYPTRSEAVFSP